METTNNANISSPFVEEIIVEKKEMKQYFWQDKLRKILYSKGSYMISIYSIMVVMLVYLYTAKPPLHINVINCERDLTLPYCLETFNKLKDGYNRLIGQCIAALVLIGTPHIIRILFEYSKQLGIAIRAPNLHSWKGALSTIVGMMVATYFGVRIFYCFAPSMENKQMSIMVCAHSVDPSFQNINNLLIQLAIAVILTIVLFILINILTIETIQDTYTVIKRKITYLRSEQFWNNTRTDIKHIFLEPPPTYQSVSQNNDIENN